MKAPRSKSALAIHVPVESLVAATGTVVLAAAAVAVLSAAIAVVTAGTVPVVSAAPVASCTTGPNPPSPTAMVVGPVLPADTTRVHGRLPKGWRRRPWPWHGSKFPHRRPLARSNRLLSAGRTASPVHHSDLPQISTGSRL